VLDGEELGQVTAAIQQMMFMLQMSQQAGAMNCMPPARGQGGPPPGRGQMEGGQGLQQGAGAGRGGGRRGGGRR
jgi:hypothetical protein